MEDVLIMNRLPFPKHFDGLLWDTQLKPTRKSIPRYLHDDLPKLRMVQLREHFEKVSKITCPKLQFFDKIIKSRRNSRTPRPKQANLALRSYEKAQEELQYALITCDRTSPVIDDLVTKAASVEVARKDRAKSRNGRQYFQRTVDLVFRNRKHMYLSGLNKVEQYDPSPEVQETISKLKLVPI